MKKARTSSFLFAVEIKFLYRLTSNNRTKGYYYLVLRHTNLVASLPSSVKGWKNHWFWVRGSWRGDSIYDLGDPQNPTVLPRSSFFKPVLIGDTYALKKLSAGFQKAFRRVPKLSEKRRSYQWVLRGSNLFETGFTTTSIAMPGKGKRPRLMLDPARMGTLPSARQRAALSKGNKKTSQTSSPKASEIPLAVQPLTSVRMGEVSDLITRRLKSDLIRVPGVDPPERGSKKAPRASKSKKGGSETAVPKSLAPKWKLKLVDETSEEDTHDSTALITRPSKKAKDDNAGVVAIGSSVVSQDAVEVCDISSSPSVDAFTRSPFVILGSSSGAKPSEVQQTFGGTSYDSASRCSHSEMRRYYHGKTPL